MSRPVLEPGATVGGKYLLLRRIGVGGMGEVWAATNRTTGAEVAVKMGLGATNREDSARRFRHEARLGAMLAHRSIVRIFDLVEEDDGTLVLVMELLRGESLERYLHGRGPLPTSEAIAIVLPILSALAHAHATGIVHRDVTPANVFLSIDPDGHVTPKLLDFGIAKIPAMASTHTIDGRALGTPRYMAPERIREHGSIDGRSDLFSVGVLLYELSTGVSPFAASSPAASLAAVLETVVDPDPRIDPRVWLELRRALSKQPYERAPTATAMASGLLMASGQTESALGQVLQNVGLMTGLSEQSPDPSLLSPAVGERSAGGASEMAAPRRRRTVARLAGVVVACTVIASALAIGAASMRDRRRATPAPLPSPSSEMTPAPALQAPPPVEPIPAKPFATSSAPATTAIAPKPIVRPARTARPKPVAITPGF